MKLGVRSSLFAAEIGGVLFEDGCKAFFFRLVQTRFEPGAEFGGEIRGEAEVYPAPVFFGVNQTRVLELLQVARDRGTGHAQPFGDLTGAEIRMMEKSQYHLETVSIGQCFELGECLVHV